MLSAKHFPLRKIPQAEIEEYMKKGFVKIDGMIPFSFKKKEKHTYISYIGMDSPGASVEESLKRQLLNRGIPELSFSYHLNDIREYRIGRSYRLAITVYPDIMQSLLRRMLTEHPDGYERYNRLTITELSNEGAVSLQETGVERLYGELKTEEVSIPAERLGDFERNFGDRHADRCRFHPEHCALHVLCSVYHVAAERPFQYPPCRCAASKHATMFSGGTSPCILWTVLKTNPPPGFRSCTLARTSSSTSSGVPFGRTLWVSIPPPQNTSLSPNSRFKSAAFMSLLLYCTGLRISTPISTRSGIRGYMEPQEWYHTFASVRSFINSISFL